MFQNIEELEKQVREFQKNILASSAFIEGIQKLTNMVETQQTQFDKDAKDVLGAIDTCTKDIKEQTDLLVKSISEQTSKEADDFAKSNEELIAKLEVRYNEFIHKLENTNVDMLFAEVQNMKKAINNKFTLLFTGVGMAIVLIIISFFI